MTTKDTKKVNAARKGFRYISSRVKELGYNPSAVKESSSETETHFCMDIPLPSLIGTTDFEPLAAAIKGAGALYHLEAHCDGSLTIRAFDVIYFERN